MPNISDKEIALANVYASSILELAGGSDAAQSLLEEFQGLVTLLNKDSDLDAFCSSPLIDEADREKSIEKMLRGRASDAFVDTIQVLNRKGRLGMIRSITDAFRAAHETRSGKVVVHVSTAVPLTDSLRAALTDAAKKYAGKEPRLVENVDPSIVGGLVVRIGDTKADMSIASRMNKLSKSLAQRASQEIRGGRAYTA